MTPTSKGKQSRNCFKNSEVDELALQKSEHRSVGKLKMDGKQLDKSTKDAGQIDPRIKRNMYGEVLYIIAWVTLGQGLCFLGAAMFQNDVRVLPDDPFTLIGSMYTAMGIAFLLISKFCGRSFTDFTVCQKCIMETQNTPENDINEKENERVKIDEHLSVTKRDVQKTTETVEYNKQLVDEEGVSDRKLTDSRDQQWDMIEAIGDVHVNASQKENQITIGCDSAVIQPSK